MPMRQFVKKYYREIMAVIWGIAFFTLTRLNVDLPLAIINRCAYIVVCFIVTAQILRATMKSNYNDIILSGALGMSCLAQKEKQV